MSVVIVDTSIVVKWFFNEPDSGIALLLKTGWMRNRVSIQAPNWILGEFVNVVLRRMRSGALSVSDGVRDFREIGRFIELLPVDIVLWARALEMTIQCRLDAVYDTIFLALAERCDGELWTADQVFWQATHLMFPRVKWLGARGFT